MAPDVRHIITLCVFFLGVAFAMWRWPKGDGWHVILSAIAAVLFCSLLVFEPATRTFGYAALCLYFLFVALFRPSQRRRSA